MATHILELGISNKPGVQPLIDVLYDEHVTSYAQLKSAWAKAEIDEAYLKTHNLNRQAVQHACKAIVDLEAKNEPKHHTVHELDPRIDDLGRRIVMHGDTELYRLLWGLGVWSVHLVEPMVGTKHKLEKIGCNESEQVIQRILGFAQALKGDKSG